MHRQRQTRATKNLVAALACLAVSVLALLPLTPDTTLARWAQDVEVTVIGASGPTITAGEWNLELASEAHWVKVKTDQNVVPFEVGGCSGSEPTCADTISEGERVLALVLVELDDSSVFTGEHLKAEVRRISPIPDSENLVPGSETGPLEVSVRFTHSCQPWAVEEFNNSCVGLSDDFKSDSNSSNILVIDISWPVGAPGGPGQETVNLDLGEYAIEIVQFR